MVKITRESNGIEEVEPHKFVAEAAELGWKNFPDNVSTDLGNGRDFIAVHVEKREGDLLFVKYLQGNGCISLTVFND